MPCHPNYSHADGFDESGIADGEDNDKTRQDGTKYSARLRQKRSETQRREEGEMRLLPM